MGVPEQVYDVARLAAVHATGLLDTGADEAFDRFSRLAATLVQAPYAFVTVVDDRRSFWKSCIGIEATDPAERQNSVEESFCQYVVGSGEQLIVDDARRDPRTSTNPSIESMGVQAWAGFPVRSPEGHVLGTFCVVDTVPRTWTARDVEVLETLSQAVSGEIALRDALDEAHQASRLLLDYGQAMAELAETLQESLLPPNLPAIPGLDLAVRYLPGGRGGKVIGDFYDAFEVPRGWAVLVGDVCGHGVEAARTTSLARHTVRAAAQQQADPAAVLRSLNHALHQEPDGGLRFVTAVYGRLRREPTGAVSVILCRAGHPPPYVVRTDRSVEPVEGPGMLLGPFEHPSLSSVPQRLEPGDALVLYTDGVLEAGPSDDQYGARRLTAQLRADANRSAQELADAIVSAAQEHAGDDVADDCAALVLRVRQPD